MRDGSKVIEIHGYFWSYGLESNKIWRADSQRVALANFAFFADSESIKAENFGSERQKKKKREAKVEEVSRYFWSY